MNADHDAIRILDVSKTYGTAAAAVHALCSVTLEIECGERVALLGKSGSAKSALLNLLGGLDRTTLVLVTHDEELAGRCTDRIIRLQDGQLE